MLVNRTFFLGAFFLALACQALPLHARTIEPVDSLPAVSAVPWYDARALMDSRSELNWYVDTTLAGFQWYDFYLPGHPFVAGKGNVGHPSRRLDFTLNPSGGFRLFGKDPYGQYRFSHEQLRFFRPQHVFSELYYVLGSSREQLFFAQHTQRLQDGLFLGFQYRVINSPGLHSRMGTKNTNLYFTGDYRHPAGRYQALASVVINKLENQQSGGLRNRLAYEEDPVRDSVFLYRAGSRLRETAFSLSHLYDLSFGREADSLRTPDQLPAALPGSINLGRITHDFAYRYQSWVFEDEAPPHPLYPFEPASPSATYDSTRVQWLENRISWSNGSFRAGARRSPLHVTASLTHEVVRIRQPLLGGHGEEEGEAYLFREATFNHLSPGLSLSVNPNGRVVVRGAASYTLGGYRDEDFSLQASLDAALGTNWHVLGSVTVESREAPYFMQHYSGNYVSWDNQFEKLSLVGAGLKIGGQAFGFEGRYAWLGNMVYLDARALPVQNQDFFPVWTARAHAKFGLGPFRSVNQVLYQHVDRDQFERFPPLMSHHSLYGDFSLFDRALQAHVGVDLTYHVPYFPMGYMPVVWQFHVQDDYESGHQFLLDVFANFQVQRTRFFVKLQHVLGLLPGRPPAYSVPFYPLPEVAFKFGVSWMFFD
jgi:hypothetical protein